MLKRLQYDIVIIGGGHNGLVASSYLSQAGLSVLILESRFEVGGATVSRSIFPGIDAKVSEYSYLLSLFPKKIIKDLGLNFTAKRRKIASYTPVFSGRNINGLLLSNISSEVTKESLKALTGSNKEYANYQTFLRSIQRVANIIWPTLLNPIISREEMKNKFVGKDEALWKMFFEQPLGLTLERFIQDDTLRGVIFTDAKIGILTHPYDQSLLQNRTFLYHVIGNGTGEWRVPVGGMGKLRDELERSARRNGVEIKLNARVEKIDPSNNFSTVQYTQKGKNYSADGRFILSCVSPFLLSKMLDQKPKLLKEDTGSLFKINLLLKKLPRLKAQDVSSKDAFTGTFHLNEGYEYMIKTYQNSVNGIIPENPAGDIYCHSLTDNSILSAELRKKSYQTMTLFGLDIPYDFFVKDNEIVKKKILSNYLASLNRFLAEPIEDCIATDSKGKLCISVKSSLDIERELNMPQGNIFHQNLSWPFSERETTGKEWGVETKFENIFICGAGARRGGAVSGIPGHNAAMKVLQILKRA